MRSDGLTSEKTLSEKNEDPGVRQEERERLQQVLYQRFGERFEVPEGLLTDEQLRELVALAGRCSHRHWTSEAVPDALVQLLLGVALSAPSKSDLQQSEVVLVKDPIQKEKVAALVPSMPWISQAPVLMVICGSGARFRRIFERANQEFVNEHLDGLFNPTTDAAMVLMHLLVAAGAVGLAGVPISSLRDRADELGRILELPQFVFPLAGLCFGYPSSVRNVTVRFGLASSIHVDRHHGSIEKMDQGIDEFDERYQTYGTLVGRKPPQSWTNAKLEQYSKTQRKDWIDRVREKGFLLD